MDVNMLFLLDAYQADSRRFAQYGQGGKLYCLLGLGSEWSEYLMAKRGLPNRDLEAIRAELGDCWWMLVNLATEYGWLISHCIQAYEQVRFQVRSIPAMYFDEALGLVMGREAKALRGDPSPLPVSPALLGAMAYELALLADPLEVTAGNIRKLQGRLDRGTIKGDGDAR